MLNTMETCLNCLNGVTSAQHIREGGKQFHPHSTKTLLIPPEQVRKNGIRRHDPYPHLQRHGCQLDVGRIIFSSIFAS
jgi:hypothetical protein